MNQELQNYINQARASGVSDEQITQTLLSSGWSQQDIETALGIGSIPVSISSTVTTDQNTFINKWSWGGFLLYVVYFLGSRNYKRAFLYFLGSAVPIWDIYLWIKSGLRGRKLVWESAKWQDFESYYRRQKLLDKIGILLTLTVILISIVSFALGKFGSSDKNTQSNNPVTSQEFLSTENPTPISQTPTTTVNNTLVTTPTPKPSTTKPPQSNIPLEIIQATLTPSQLIYPFSNASLKVVLRNNTSQQIKEYNYRFFLDKAPYFGQRIGNDLAYIDPGTIYQMDSFDTQGAINELSESCVFFGLEAGQYNIHLKISSDTTKPLNADTTGPLVTDKLVPFTLTTSCQKK